MNDRALRYFLVLAGGILLIFLPVLHALHLPRPGGVPPMKVRTKGTRFTITCNLEEANLLLNGLEILDPDDPRALTNAVSMTEKLADAIDHVEDRRK